MDDFVDSPYSKDLNHTEKNEKILIIKHFKGDYTKDIKPKSV